MLENNFNNVKEFEKELIKTLESMAEYYKHDINIRKESITKINNNEKNGICVTFNQNSIASTIYPQDLYSEYLNSGREFYDFADVIYGKLYEAQINVANINIDKLCEKAQDNLILRIANKNDNPKLAELPHIDIPGDYIAVTYIQIDNNDNTRATALVGRDVQANVLKLTDEEMLMRAAKNSLNPDNFICKSLGEIITSISGGMGIGSEINDYLDEGEPLMYIISSRNHLDGAVALASQDVLQNLILDKIKEYYPDEKNYYIIPSSIHELICIPESSVDNPENLHDMCVEVNETDVSKEDRLGDNILHYSSDTQKLNVCNSMEDLKRIKEETMQNIKENVSKIALRRK